jgi:basic membrane protein A
VENDEEYSDDLVDLPDEELEALLLARSELSHALRAEHDPQRRHALLSRLSENRAEILRMQRELGIDSPQSAALRTSRSYLVDPWQSDTSEQPASPGPYGYDIGDAVSPPMGGRHPGSDYFRGGGPTYEGATGGAASRMSRSMVAFALTAVLGVLAATLAFRLFNDLGSGQTGLEAAEEGADGQGEASAVEQIRSVITGMGLSGVVVEEVDGVIHLIGVVPTEAEKTAVVGAAEALAGDTPVGGDQLIVDVEGSALGGEAASGAREAALQAEIDRVIAATPILFEVGETELNELQLRILNNVVAILLAYPDFQVAILGYTDDQGAEEANRAISLARAESVQSYLVSQGVAESSLVVQAVGEEDSSQSLSLANLERRVEFQVVPAAGGALVPDDSDFKIAIVAPSARNDLAFTQSMVDAVNAVAVERGNVHVSITDGAFVIDEAVAAIEDYAAQDYDLVIAHGSQYGGALKDLAPQYPEVAFAWGTASDTFELPNVYAYDAASEQGGYILGALSASLSEVGVIGVVGPIEVGDAERYVNGFKAGAEAEGQVDVRVTYIDSFSDTTLAASAAQEHVDAGADVMTGSAQMVVGAISVAEANGVHWFGTQANQTSMASDLVVASQVYHWEVILRQIVADIDNGVQTGQAYSATLANGGLVIEFNPALGPDPELVEKADELTAAIVDGSIVAPTTR